MPSTSYPHYAWAGELSLTPVSRYGVADSLRRRCRRTFRRLGRHGVESARPGRKGVPHSVLGRTRILGDRRRASPVCFRGSATPADVGFPLPSTSGPRARPPRSTRAWGRRKSTAPTCSAPSSTRTSSTSSSPSTGSSRWAGPALCSSSPVQEPDRCVALPAQKPIYVTLIPFATFSLFHARKFSTLARLGIQFPLPELTQPHNTVTFVRTSVLPKPPAGTGAKPTTGSGSTQAQAQQQAMSAGAQASKMIQVRARGLDSRGG